MIEKQKILSALREGILQLEGQFIYGSNYTFMVNCQYQSLQFKAVYKPMRGERPLWDFPIQTLARREVAAFILSDSLGWNLVPPTVFRTKKAPMGAGSVQYYIEHDPEYHYFTFQEKDRASLPRVMLFDLLINNADRKGGHLLVDPEGKLWLIDHGLSFHVEEKLRTVVWDHAGQPIPGSLLTDVQRIIEALLPDAPLYQSLQPHLLKGEIEALKNRAETLIKSAKFPLPPEERRAYPWPLV
jgi:uncharacterized repeat protein (TIGR03843 family)